MKSICDNLIVSKDNKKEKGNEGTELEAKETEKKN
jgi:hypothetical protein